MLLKILQNSEKNTCNWASFFLNKVYKACSFIQKETLAQVFFCEFYKISKNTFFTEHLWTTASGQKRITIEIRIIPIRGKQVWIAKWESPEDMAIYANMFSKKYIPESNIEEKILKENTIPLNINRGKEVDDFVLPILGRSHLFIHGCHLPEPSKTF